MFKNYIKSWPVLIVSFIVLTACGGGANSANTSTPTPSSSTPTPSSSVTIQKSDFVGNIFQLIVYNLGEQAISTGTGFVFHEEGWFFTNSHVVENGYSAKAIFDIPNQSEGSFFTNLEINLGAHNDNNKDFFIGKIRNYSLRLNQYYKQFEFTTEYNVGDVTYSVGYPNSSIDLRINRGTIRSNLSSIYDKVNSGVIYIGSSSYIAPGSSGGILIDANRRILGITTIAIYDKNGSFDIGGSISTFNFINTIRLTNNSQFSDFGLFLHPSEKKFIMWFRKALADSKISKSVCIDMISRNLPTLKCSYVAVEEGSNEDGLAYSSEVSYGFWLDFSGGLESEMNWSNGDKRILRFSGKYSHTRGILDMDFFISYTYKNGRKFALESHSINFSDNLDLTLNTFFVPQSFSTPNNNELIYIKEIFNFYYLLLHNQFNKYS